MLKKTLIFVLALSMILGMATTAFASENLGNQPSDEVETEQVDTENEPEGKYAGVSSEIMAVIEGLDSQDYAEGELLVIYEDAESAEFAVACMCAKGEEASQNCGDEVVKVIFDENEISMEDKIIELSKEENVKYVQPNYIYSLVDGVDYYEAYEKIAEMMTVRMEDAVNDAYADNQLYLSQVHMAEAWAIVNKYGTSKVKVAVIDTGIQANHEDFTNLNKDLCVQVENHVSPYPKQTYDDHGQGCNTTGVIGATANNGKGIAGGASLGKTDVSSRLEVFSIDAFYRSFIYPSSWEWVAKSSDVRDSLIFAVDNGAKVISMSVSKRITTEWTDDVMKAGIDYAYSKGAICVCAGGDKGYNSDKTSTYPSDYDKVISVIALDTIFLDDGEIGQWANEGFTRACFSNYGNARDISAPGVNKLSVAPDNDSTSEYGYRSSTSQASAIVASVIALMFMMNPNLTYDQVYSIVTSTATDLEYEYNYDKINGKGNIVNEPAGKGFDIYTAYGMINAEACVLALAPEVFSDVHKADWFYSSVSDMYYRGIMTGMGGTNNFGPGEKLQREQLATILYRLEGSPSPVTYEAKFKDVPAGTWFTDPIIWAYQHGIITGYTTGYFGVGDPITREQFATMLYRYATNRFTNYVWYYGKADLSTYPDASQVSDWAEEAMEWAVGAGIITGKQGGVYLDPGGNAQRCEAATMIQRFQYKFQF